MKIKKKNQNKESVKRTPAQWIAYVYLLMMLGVFPLFYTDNYINIMESKWYVFMIPTLIAFLSISACQIVTAVKTGKKPDLQAVRTMPPYDKILVFFFAALMISWIGTFFIGLPKESFFGTMGKLSGTFLYLVLIAAFVIIISYGRFDNVVKHVFLWCNFIVFFLALLNHFMVDPLNMYVNLDPEQYWMFCSTMGNVNVLSGYFSVFVPITVAFFIWSDNMDESLMLGLIMIVSFMGLIAANGDAGILGVLGACLVLLWFSFSDVNRLTRFFFSVAVFFTGAAIVGSMDDSFAGTVKDALDTLPAFISKSAVNRAGIVVGWGLFIALLILGKKKKEVDLRKVRNVLFGIFAALFILIMAVFIYFSVVDTAKDLGRWETYLRFSDLWGSSRGFTWKRTMIMYLQHYNIFQKLFGYGPDLLIEPYHTYFHEQIMEKMGAYLADAHSEFFQTLASMGLAGVIGYFGFMIAALASLFKSASAIVSAADDISGKKIDPRAGIFIIAASAGVFGYMIQGFLCSPQPISTPVVFVVMALAMSCQKNIKVGKKV